MKYRLSDLCEYRKEKVPVSDVKIEDYISTENMLPNKEGITIAASIPNTGKVSRYKKGDILVSNIRPYFQKIWLADREGTCSNDILIINANCNVSHEYLYYSLTSDKFFLYMMSTSKGTKMPRGDKKAIMQFELDILSREKQEKAITLLSLLDKKIHANRMINNNLEQQAQAIFMNKLLSLSKVPDDYKKSNLLDIAKYVNGLAMQKYRPPRNDNGLPVLKIKEFRQGFCDNNSDICSSNIKEDYIIHDGDVVFSWSGTLLVGIWCGGTCGLNQHLFKVTSSHYDKWFYYSWTKYHLDRFIAIASDKATTMGHIKREDLIKAEVLIPSRADYQEIGKLLQPIYDLIISNRIEIKKLVILRDTLLPKLLSGELDVSNIDI